MVAEQYAMLKGLRWSVYSIFRGIDRVQNSSTRRLPALQHPAVTPRQVLVEHPGAIERDLSPETIEINGVATRPFEQACFEGDP